MKDLHKINIQYFERCEDQIRSINISFLYDSEIQNATCIENSYYDRLLNCLNKHNVPTCWATIWFQKRVFNCCFDLSRAYDLISHELLSFKCEKYGIHGSTASWIQSYVLSGRIQLTVY